jgi:hypothetical protein
MTLCDALDLIAAAAQLFEGWRRPGRAGIRIRSTATLELSAKFTQPVQRSVSAFSRAAHKLRGKP